MCGKTEWRWLAIWSGIKFDLRSVNRRSNLIWLSIEKSALSSYGHRTFSAAGLRLWNSLVVQLCNPDITYWLLRWQLKGHFVGKHEHSAPWLLICWPHRTTPLTYLQCSTEQFCYSSRHVITAEMVYERGTGEGDFACFSHATVIIKITCRIPH